MFVCVRLFVCVFHGSAIFGTDVGKLGERASALRTCFSVADGRNGDAEKVPTWPSTLIGARRSTRLH